jgi:hypothetical protein
MKFCVVFTKNSKLFNSRSIRWVTYRAKFSESDWRWTGRCQIIEYSRLSNSIYTDHSSFSNFLLLLQVVYTSNQRNNFINVLFTMDESVQGIQENMILNWFLDK